MLIKIQQFLFGKNHSWSSTSIELGRELIKQGHEVDFISTDGNLPQFTPEDLKQYIKTAPRQSYDAQFSYTFPRNFPKYIANGNKNRLGLWSFEFPILPGWSIKYINSDYCDKFIAISKWFYDICIENKINKDKLIYIPHGINKEQWYNSKPIDSIKKDGMVSWLTDFAQPHYRKNITGTLEAWGMAFTKNDNVQLVMKVKDKKPEQSFEINFSHEFEKFKKRWPNHAKVKVIKEYLPSMESLYKSCDGLFMIPNSEAFFLPGLQMLASGGVVITSNYAGQLDYLNENNSVLINGKIVRAPANYQYWTPNIQSTMFEPNLDEAAEKLIYATNNISVLKEKFHANLDSSFWDHYSWKSVAEKLVSLC